MPEEYVYNHINKDIFGFHRSSNIISNFSFHLHNHFELYLFLQGDVNCFVEQSMYRLKKGTLMMFNDKEFHKSYNLSTNTYERIVINFNPEIIKRLTTQQTNLLSCFMERERSQNNAILLSKKQLDIYLTLAYKLIEASERNEFGEDLLALSYLMQLLVFVNKAYKHDDNMLLEQYPISEMLQKVLEFINANYMDSLSLDIIANNFSINKSYLSRMFKKETGVTIYNYVLLKRISLAKQLLSEGHNVTETCSMCGFNDFANFSRAFKQITGYPPSRIKTSL